MAAPGLMATPSPGPHSRTASGGGGRELFFDVGSDVGGTFTDLWVRDSDGATTVVKSPTTADLVGGVVTALRCAAEAYGLEVVEFCRRVRRFGHGTTVGLNALLTGRAGRTAVITTLGFADTLEIGRMKRQFSGLSDADVSDYMKRSRTPPIVPRRLVLEVPERVDRTGAVLAPLHEDDARSVVEAALDDDVQAVAICTLWSSANPSHENRLRRLVHEARPSLPVSVSHEVAPSVGEYARMSTTAANAALKPVMSSYLTRLRTTLGELGVDVPVLMMSGAGGVVPAEHLAEVPVAALLSGPAAGVVACQQLGRLMGVDRILTTDIGGTSFDVGLVVNGAPLMASDFSFGGVDIRMPCVDVRSIGAGGGSIASVAFGGLTVGPHSAGADPGPACYGRGGRLATATDADIVLGLLADGDHIGGTVILDRAAAEHAISRDVAKPLGIGVERAAWGIRHVLDNRMADLLRQVTIERGHDPRSFTMFAGGGSGPSHGWALARELGLTELVVPATATVQSAFGAGTSDIMVTSERPVHLRLRPDAELDAAQAEQLRRAIADTAAEVIQAPLGGMAAGDPLLLQTVAVRYLGQSHHLHVPVAAEASTTGSLHEGIERFESAYEALFGRGAGYRTAGFEVVAVRALATRALSEAISRPTGGPIRRVGLRSVWFDDPDHPVQAHVYAAEFPAPGQRVSGPCLITYPGQTAVVPPGATAESDAFGNLIVRLG
ncbi:MAG: hydantoinase/oxoprolinase family protein [Solirubrobacteraceae bacterium]